MTLCRTHCLLAFFLFPLLASAQIPASMYMTAHKRAAQYTVVLPQKQAQQDVTFSEHIAPILWKNCASCHRAGEIAPFTLTSYQDAAKRATMLAAVTHTGYMPPWKPSETYGKFADARGLTQEEIDLFAAWAAAGAPQGDPQKTPPLPQFSSGSQLGTPDIALKMSQSWKVKGDKQDVYRNFVLPTELVKDRTIAAIEFRPGNPKVVHHALMFLDTSGAGRKLDAQDPGYGYVGFGGPGFTPAKNLLGWVPGMTPRFFPTGLGITMYAKSDLVVQIHYAPSDADAEDLSTVNVFFAKEGVNREIQQAAITPNALVSGQFVIPAGQTKKFVGRIGGSQIPADVSLLAVAPHMHLLGKNCRSYAVTPGRDTIKLISIDDWDFHWQGYYMMKNLVKLPKGTDLYYEADYDNTVNNPENPNSPPKQVQWGESTFDEMFLSYYLYTTYRQGDENISMETQNPLGVPDIPAASDGLTVVPNPTGNTAVAVFRAETAADAALEIADMLGAVVYRAAVHVAAGENAIALPTAEFPVGSYVCRIRSGFGLLCASLFGVVR